MKIYNIFFIFIIFLSLSSKADIIKKEISNKYSEIFSNKILSSDDVNYYVKKITQKL